MVVYIVNIKQLHSFVVCTLLAVLRVKCFLTGSYHCLQGNYKADVNYCCPLCGTKIAEADSIQPIVLPLSVTAPNDR